MKDKKIIKLTKKEVKQCKVSRASLLICFFYHIRFIRRCELKIKEKDAFMMFSIITSMIVSGLLSTNINYRSKSD
jgi:hypothetical protein